MNVLVFGATGMVGQGVLRECLLAPDVTQVTAVGRARVEQDNAKLHQIVLPDLGVLQAVEGQLRPFDACFFCLGVSSVGMSEDAYRKLSVDLTLSIARTLLRLNPTMKFAYVSGAGTDGTEQGRTMWARVKGKTENDLKALPFASVQLFRPGVIQPLHGVRSKTRLYQTFYDVLGPALTLLRRLMPDTIVTTEDVGIAMLNGARHVNGAVVLEAKDIAQLARQGPASAV